MGVQLVFVSAEVALTNGSGFRQAGGVIEANLLSQKVAGYI